MSDCAISFLLWDVLVAEFCTTLDELVAVIHGFGFKPVPKLSSSRFFLVMARNRKQTHLLQCTAKSESSEVIGQRPQDFGAHRKSWQLQVTLGQFVPIDICELLNNFKYKTIIACTVRAICKSYSVDIASFKYWHNHDESK